MTKARDDISPEYVAAVLDYCPESGVFRWRHRPSASAQWNGKFAGKAAGTINDRGYVIICIDGADFRGHRLAWVIMKGCWPEHEIDHRNLCKSYNAWENLREATHVQNNQNKPAQSNNTSGYKGVSYCKMTRSWVARIKIGGKYEVAGRSDTPEGAAEMYKAAAQRNHGDFARMEEANGYS